MSSRGSVCSFPFRPTLPIACLWSNLLQESRFLSSVTFISAWNRTHTSLSAFLSPFSVFCFAILVLNGSFWWFCQVVRHILCFVRGGSIRFWLSCGSKSTVRCFPSGFSWAFHLGSSFRVSKGLLTHWVSFFPFPPRLRTFSSLEENFGHLQVRHEGFRAHLEIGQRKFSDYLFGN